MKKDYQLKGNPVVDVPVIGTLVYDDLGKEVVAKFNERFKGVEGIEYTHKHKTGEPISYSNVPRVLGMNQEQREITRGNITLLTPAQVVRFWDVISERGPTYADTDGISLYPTEGPNEELRQEVLKLTGKSSKHPLIISGLGVEGADNDLGFRFVGTDYMGVIEAPYLSKDGRVTYDPSQEGLVGSDEGVSIWTPDAQSGLRGLYRDGGDGLYAGNGSLLGSDSGGRVQVISGSATSPDLETHLAQLKHEETEARAKVERIKQAQAILTGK
ncbi:hypothetical protein K8R33_00715 [archaeon]|nr:hypothetical protein [archaeon]